MFNLAVLILFGEVTVVPPDDSIQESTDEISIVSFIPESGSTTIEGGESLELWCNVDDHWEWCTFSHVPSGK